MYNLNDQDKCLCNSGKDYIDCCKSLVNEYDFIGLVNKADDFRSNNKADLALAYLLAAYTSYMINVKRHTENANFPKVKFKETLIEIDVNALDELIDKIVRLIARNDINYDFLEFIKSSRRVFYNKKWHEKLNYFNILWYYVISDNKEKAIEFIKDNIDINITHDFKLLDIISDVYLEELSTRQKLDIFEKLINQSDTELRKSNIIMRKAMIYLSLNDLDTYNNLIKNALELCEKNYSEDISIIDKYNCAKIYTLYGKQDSTYINKSIEIYEYFLNKEIFKNDYELYWNLANNYFYIGNYEKAISNYLLAKKIQNTNESKIELARSFIRNSEYEKSEEILLEINYEELINELKMDYLTAYSELCLYKNTDKIEFVINELKGLQSISNYFDSYIKDTIIMLYEIKDNKLNTKKKQNWIKRLNKIIMLKPNFFGLGIDINETINLFDKK